MKIKTYLSILIFVFLVTLYISSKSFVHTSSTLGEKHEENLSPTSSISSDKESGNTDINSKTEQVTISLKEIIQGEIDSLSKEKKIKTLENPPIIFERKKYLDKAKNAKKYIRSLLLQYRELEASNGIVTHTHDDGSKNSVDIMNAKGDLIGKLVYFSDDYVHQIVEWQDDEQNGYTAFLDKEGRPYKIFSFKNNKLNGPYFEFKKNQPHEGALIYYVEFKNHKRKGLCIGWTSDGEPLEGSQILDESHEWKGLP